MPNKHQVIDGKVVVLMSHGQAGPGKSASIQLYSATELDTRTGRGRLTLKASLKNGESKKVKGIKAIAYRVKIRVDMEFGIPGAMAITSKHENKFFLKSASFQAQGTQSFICFDCNSWVYPVERSDDTPRIFFSNTSYLPSQTPEALEDLRRGELCCLRGNGTGERVESDRIYDYDYYNDLGNPSKGEGHTRPVLGGNASCPYPRRLRTGRPRSQEDPSCESRPVMPSLNVCVPPDEQLNPRKLPGLLSNSIQSLVHFLGPGATSLFRDDYDAFDSFDHIWGLFCSKDDGRSVPNKKTRHRKSQELLKFPLPQIAAEDKWAWKSDAEFARQMLAGTNPTRIQCLQEFPPVSKSTGAVSSIEEYQIEPSLEGLTVYQAIHRKRMFILDHHDYLMPFLGRINKRGVVRAYASRTLLFLRDDSTMKPVAIELSLPGAAHGSEFNRVFRPVPASRGDSEAALWQLAKAHVTSNDSAYHHLVSHWLHTHAVVEPFIIATRRQLSKMHPIHRLLDPHFEDTIHINALARQVLVSDGGILETTLFTKKVSMEVSSMLYRDWRFDEQGLPSDLLKRGMGVKDPNSPAGVKLLFDDYPYAADGLEIWTALKRWVAEYCTIFYRGDSLVGSDEELQAWWWEIRNVGHGDKKEETWWYQMTTLSDLIETITTLIWTTSALHASVVSGQFAYAGFPPSRPGLCRRFIPKEGTFEFAKFLQDTERYYLEMLPGRVEMTLMVSLTEALSRHTSNEVLYLGQRWSDWTDNQEVIEKIDNFNWNLRHIGERILERNKNPNLKNRSGPAKIPYEILLPIAETAERAPPNAGRGIPNSISI
ncbi:hypothetical protein SAY86_012583 [Trapa natans]|uniref:Lipoxygenase n=1 Tax=Trapa natans TaxID=22666 RepID=A0AAN7LY74_TRANT|nr:hypothetical protein SAY86_012583 [Trapa natans]